MSDLGSERLIDVDQMGHHALADRNCLDFAEFEGERHDDMTLFRRCLADEELSRLAVVIRETFGTKLHLRA
ncbi:hypothetical protein D3C71_1046840 [compost metagenome]